MANEALIGKQYVDQKDSDDLVMEVFAVDTINPDVVWVHPIGIDRVWWRSAQHIREIEPSTPTP